MQSTRVVAEPRALPVPGPEPARARRGCARGRAALLAAAAALAAAAGCTAAAPLAHGAALHVRLPIWDEWEIMPLFQRAAGGTLGWFDLVHRHNEHRILIPRLVFLADARFAALSGWLDLSAVALLQAANAAVLGALACRLVRDGASRLLLCGFVGLMLSTLRQEQNFSSGFQLQFVGVFTAQAAAALAGAAALARPRGGTGGAWLPLAGAAAGCAAATFTMANGVLAAPVLGVLALLCGAPRRLQAAAWALSALLAFLFFHGYAGDSAAGPLSPAPPIAYARFVAAYLGNPVEGTLRGAQALGVLGLALLAGAAWRTATARARDPASLALLAVAGFAAATAAATAYGRVDGGTEAAFESRYATTSLIFWSAIVAHWFPAAAGAARPRIPLAALGALMAALAAAALVAEADAWAPLARRSAAMRRVSDSLMAGLYDADAADAYEIMPPEVVAEALPFLREHRLAAFADPEYLGLGRPIGRAAPPGACSGAAAATPALGPGGVRLSGWAVDRAAGRAPRRIVVTDASGTVVGFGSAALPGEPSRLWTGYARAGAGEALRAYARLSGGAPCLIAEAAVAPARPPAQRPAGASAEAAFSGAGASPPVGW